MTSTRRFYRCLALCVVAIALTVPSAFATGSAEAPAGTGSAAGEQAGDVDWSQFSDSRNPADPDKFPKDEDGVPHWPWDTTPTTFEWFLNFSWFASTPWNADATLLHGIIRDKTGINIDLVIPPSGEERLNALIAANDLPDLITTPQNAQQLQLLIGADRVFALNELADQYNPGFLDRVPASLQDWFTAEDGNWYIFPNNFVAPEDVEAAPPGSVLTTPIGVWARQEIMDQLGISPEDFSTQEGLIQALRQVRDAGLTYRGQDVIPAIIGEDGGIYDTFQSVLPQMFAIPMEDTSGNYVDWRFHPKALEMIQFGNTLVREGLVLRENLTATDQQIDEWENGGLVFLGLRGISGTPGGLIQNEDENWTAVPVAMPAASDGGEPVIIRSGTGSSGTVVPRSASNPAKLIRFIDFMYSNPVFTFWGVEGETFTWGDDGHVVYTPQVAAARAEGWRTSALQFGTQRFAWLLNRFVADTVMPEPASRQVRLEQVIQEYSLPWVVPTNAFEGLQPPAGTRELDLFARTEDIWNEQLVRMLIADEDEVEDLYFETLDRMRNAGFDQVLAVMNDRFQANKERLGLSSAYPADRRADPSVLY